MFIENVKPFITIEASIDSKIREIIRINEKRK